MRKELVKSILLVFLAILLTISLVFAAPNIQKIVAYINGDLKMTFNDEAYQPKESDGKPLMPLVYNNRTYLPLKAIAQLLGAQVDYDNDSKTIMITSDFNGANPYKDGQDQSDVLAVPQLTGRVDGSKILLAWSATSDTRLDGYKVVISKYSESPKYPENGYLYWITDKTKTYAVVDNHEIYKNGDFGDYLTPGETYYLSVTAIYGENKVCSNVLRMQFPKNSSDNGNPGTNPSNPGTPAPSESYAVPQLTGSIDGKAISLKWNVISDNRLQGYKVVVSKNNSSPKYPEDGYMYWITDKNRSYTTIDNHEPYKNGDFGAYLTPGEEYYFSITAVYNDKNVPGNTIRLKYPEGSSTGGSNTSAPAPYRVPMLTSRIDGKAVILIWDSITNDSRFSGYKVVISKNNSTPKYPSDGYLYWITDKTQNYAVLDNHEAYKSGDFGSYLIPGEEYYVSITAVYGDLNVAGNAVKIKYPQQ